MFTCTCPTLANNGESSLLVYHVHLPHSWLVQEEVEIRSQSCVGNKEFLQRSDSLRRRLLLALLEYLNFTFYLLDRQFSYKNYCF